MAVPNPEELQLLSEFRDKLKDLHIPKQLNVDMELLRWIRARENNIEQAQLMFRKHLKWRMEIDFDNIGSWEAPEMCEKLLPEEFIGYDDDNCPLVVTLIGKWDLKYVLNELGLECTLKVIVKRCAWVMDQMRTKLTPEGVSVTQFSHLIDLEGLSASQGSLAVFRGLTAYGKIFESNFPESLKMEVIINAPWFFPMFYKCMKPFLSQKTVDKIHIYGKDRDEWTAFLKKSFPARLLPLCYGGSNDNFKLF